MTATANDLAKIKTKPVELVLIGVLFSLGAMSIGSMNNDP